MPYDLSVRRLDTYNLATNRRIYSIYADRFSVSVRVLCISYCIWLRHGSMVVVAPPRGLHDLWAATGAHQRRDSS